MERQQRQLALDRKDINQATAHSDAQRLYWKVLLQLNTCCLPVHLMTRSSSVSVSFIIVCARVSLSPAQAKLEEVEKLLTDATSGSVSVTESDASLRAMLSDALNDAESRLGAKGDELSAARDNIESLQRDMTEVQAQLVIVTAEKQAIEVCQCSLSCDGSLTLVA